MEKTKKSEHKKIMLSRQRYRFGKQLTELTEQQPFDNFNQQNRKRMRRSEQIARMYERRWDKWFEKVFSTLAWHQLMRK